MSTTRHGPVPRKWRWHATLAAVCLGLALLAGPAAAVNPDEVLADPALEERAREISKDVRCLVCRNESIDSSNAELARDLRLLIRERLVEGDTDAEVKDYLVDRYGEFVLLNPRMSLANAFLWLAGPAMLILGGIAVGFYLRGRRPGAAATEAPLTAQERAELDRILNRGDPGDGR